MHHILTLILILGLTNNMSAQSISILSATTENLLDQPRSGALIIATSQGGFADTAITDENGQAELIIHHDFTLGINEIPVPLMEGKADITLFNILGQQVWTGEQELFAGMNHIQQGTSHLSSGTYIFRIETAQGVMTKKALYIKNARWFGQLDFQIGRSDFHGNLRKQSELREDTHILLTFEPSDSSRAFLGMGIALLRTDTLDFSETFVVNDLPMFTVSPSDSIVTGPFQLDVSGMVENDNATVFSLLASNGGSITTSGLISWNPSIDGDTTQLAVIAIDIAADGARDTSEAFTLTYDSPIQWSEVDIIGRGKIMPNNQVANYTIFNYICQDDTTINITINNEDNTNGYYEIQNLPFIAGESSTYKLEISPTANSNPQFQPRTIYHEIDENTIGFVDTVYTLIHNRDAAFTIRDLDDTSRVSGLMGRVRDSEGAIVQMTITDDMGIASFTDLLPGSYHLELDGGTDYLSRITAFSISDRTTHADSIYSGNHNFTMIGKERPLPGTLDETVEMTATELKEGMMANPPTNGNVYAPLAQNQTRYVRLDSFTPEDSTYFITYLAEGDSLFGINSDQWEYVNEFPAGEDGIDINTFGDNETNRRYGEGGVVGATISMTDIRYTRDPLYKEVYGRTLMGLSINVTSRPSVFNASAANIGPKDRGQFSTRTKYLQLKYDPQHASNPLEQGYQSDFLDELSE